MITKIEVMRAEQEWQRAGAYSVRIQGMNRQYHIPLREEFDEHDGEGTRYIVLLDDGYPIATARFYEKDEKTVIVGRVVVLPEYRGKNLGSRLLQEAEQWISELGYREIEVDSRTVAISFYEKNGFQRIDVKIIKSGSFDYIKMYKVLGKQM
jgi:GNAT superfamily N-acetyltransferase